MTNDNDANVILPELSKHMEDISHLRLTHADIYLQFDAYRNYVAKFREQCVCYVSIRPADTDYDRVYHSEAPTSIPFLTNFTAVRFTGTYQQFL
jgi:hypothetical protein